MAEQAGRSNETPGFVGRQRELAALRRDIARAGLDTLAGRPAPHSRILLVAGRPGYGRTALAAELVRRLIPVGDHPDGVLHVRLTEPDGTPVPTERTARRLLDALGVATLPGVDGDDLADDLRATLDSRRVLLLLDDVATPEQLLDLLPDSRDCLVVATADGPLTGVPDVRPCTLGGLDRQAAVALLTQGAGEVRVTVDPRAAEALAEECDHQPAALVLIAGWLAAHPEAAVVDALLRLRALGGPPPGRRPAGAATVRAGARHTAVRTGARTPTHAGTRVPASAQPAAGPPPVTDPTRPDAERAERREDREPGAYGEQGGYGEHGEHGAYDEQGGADSGEWPTADHGDAVGLETPLQRAFHLVRRSLSPVAGRMLPLLSLAPAGYLDAQLASALAGCSVSTAATALEDFTALGLLRSAPPAAPRHRGPTAASAPQYTVPRCLHPLLREALENAERPSEVLLARARMLERTVRHLRSCWASAEPDGSPARAWAAALPRSLRFASAATAATWLHARQPALLAAARGAAADDSGELDTLARRLNSHLIRALVAHRTPREAAPELYRLHELTLRVTERGGHHRESAAALLALGDLDAGQGDWERALSRYRGALTAARAGGDTPATARALESLGETHERRGDRQRAADWYGRALTLCQTGGDLVAQARLHGRIAAAHGSAGQWTAALRAWRAAAATHRRLRDRVGYARALGEVVVAQQQLGQPYEALRSGQEALQAAARAPRTDDPAGGGGDGGAALAADTALPGDWEVALRQRLAALCDLVGDHAAARGHRRAAADGPHRAPGNRAPRSGA